MGTGRLDAAVGQEIREVTDARLELRWPDYTDVCVQRGSLSSLAVPVPVRDSTHGSLSMYGREADAFDDVSRAVIEPAKGILMSQRGCNASDAFTLLAAASQRSNRKLRDIAQSIVDGVGGPAPEPRNLQRRPAGEERGGPLQLLRCHTRPMSSRRSADSLSGLRASTTPDVLGPWHLHWFRWAEDDPLGPAGIYVCRCGRARPGF